MGNKVELAYSRSDRRSAINRDNYTCEFDISPSTIEGFDFSNPYSTPQGVGVAIARCLYVCEEGSNEPKYSEVSLFRSLSLIGRTRDSDGNPTAPFLVASRDSVDVFGAASGRDDLFYIKKACLDELAEQREQHPSVK